MWTSVPITRLVINTSRPLFEPVFSSEVESGVDGSEVKQNVLKHFFNIYIF